MFSKTLIVLATAAFAMAAPAAHQVNNEATCAYTMTPSIEVPELDLQTEVNYTIGRAIAESVPSGIIVGSNGFTPVLNDNGSYTNTGTVEAVGLTADELKALVTAWPGRTLEGTPWLEIVWTVDAVTCE